MRIGFVGNTNNSPFVLARAMRRLGHDVQFVVNDDYLLHRPESRYADMGPQYPDWIHDVGKLIERECVTPNPRREEIVAIMRGCDLVVLNQFGHAIAELIDRPSISILTGSDLDYYASQATLTRLYPGWDPLANPLYWPSFEFSPVMWRQLIEQQRRGIARARLVCYMQRGLLPHGDALLDGLGVPDERRYFPLMTDAATLHATRPPQNRVLRIFSAVRCSFKKPLPVGFSPLDDKGNDVLIRGLASFVRATGRAVEVRLVRKGQDVEEADAIIEEEGLAPHVTWLPEMSTQQVWGEMRAADIVLEQCGTSLVALGGLDAMALARPVIADGRPDIVEPMVGEPSPICQATTAAEIAAHLARLALDPHERARVGRESRRYVERFFSADRVAQTMLDRALAPRSFLPLAS